MIIPHYPQQGFPVGSDWGVKVVDCLRALQPRGGRNIRVSPGNDGTIIEAISEKQNVQVASAGIDFSKFCFGYTISENNVTIIGGEITVGTVTHILVTTTFPVSTDYSYIGVAYGIGGATFIGPSADVALFRPDASAMRRWLYQFRYTPPVEPATVGSVSLHRAGVFNIFAEGNFA